MTKVIEAPPSLDDVTFEQIFEALAPLSPDEKILIDARRTRWALPYGLTALLALAQTFSAPPSPFRSSRTQEPTGHALNSSVMRKISTS